MNWTEIILKIPTKYLESAENIAHMVVPYGIYTEDYSQLEKETEDIAHINLIDEELLKKDRNNALVHIYIKPDQNPNEAVSFLSERLHQENINYEITYSNIKLEDYLNNWKKYFKPTEIGEKILICPSWENIPCNTDRIKLNIDPGLAFGTGNHETTRLCLELLEKYIDNTKTVLDIGCGSGILSIASLLLGAKSAIGVDIDNLAIKTANENAIFNGVEDRFEGINGDLTDKINEKFDIIFANIVADVLIKLNQNVEKYMNRGCIYIISGIISSREKDVLNSLKSNFKIIDRNIKNDWVALAITLK